MGAFYAFAAWWLAGLVITMVGASWLYRNLGSRNNGK